MASLIKDCPLISLFPDFLTVAIYKLAVELPVEFRFPRYRFVLAGRKRVKSPLEKGARL